MRSLLLLLFLLPAMINGILIRESDLRESENCVSDNSRIICVNGLVDFMTASSYRLKGPFAVTLMALGREHRPYSLGICEDYAQVKKLLIVGCDGSVYATLADCMTKIICMETKGELRSYLDSLPVDSVSSFSVTSGQLRSSIPFVRPASETPTTTTALPFTPEDNSLVQYSAPTTVIVQEKVITSTTLADIITPGLVRKTLPFLAFTVKPRSDQLLEKIQVIETTKTQLPLQETSHAPLEKLKIPPPQIPLPETGQTPLEKLKIPPAQIPLTETSQAPLEKLKIPPAQIPLIETVQHPLKKPATRLPLQETSQIPLEKLKLSLLETSQALLEKLEIPPAQIPLTETSQAPLEKIKIPPAQTPLIETVQHPLKKPATRLPLQETSQVPLEKLKLSLLETSQAPLEKLKIPPAQIPLTETSLAPLEKLKIPPAQTPLIETVQHPLKTPATRLPLQKTSQALLEKLKIPPAQIPLTETSLAPLEKLKIPPAQTPLIETVQHPLKKPATRFPLQETSQVRLEKLKLPLLETSQASLEKLKTQSQLLFTTPTSTEKTRPTHSYSLFTVAIQNVPSFKSGQNSTKYRDTGMGIVVWNETLEYLSRSNSSNNTTPACPKVPHSQIIRTSSLLIEVHHGTLGLVVLAAFCFAGCVLLSKFFFMTVRSRRNRLGGRPVPSNT